ncbi:MAG TPA: HAMP domain-containing sensor histidine kinase [Stellaceae bacterium]|nr:HAMP domain-containing sensor histidine kinase [Stellaceae bacterium]
MPRWPSRYAVAALGAAAILPPLVLIIKPGDLGRIGGVPIAIALTALLILITALVALATALLGLERLRDNCCNRDDGEHVRAGLRVVIAAIAVGYCAAMTIAMPDGLRPAAVIVASLGLAGGWMLLLCALADPATSPLRLYLAMLLDASLISAFLHFGGELTAPWMPLYLLATYQIGLSRGIVTLAASTALNFAGFGVVVATTPYWREQPLLAGGLLAALVALPACLARAVHELAALRETAASAQAARTRVMMVVSEALRAPLDNIVGRGGTQMHEPESATAAPSTRALLSQVSNILDFTAIETGAFVPVTESFDLHRVIQDTLADRRTEAAAKGLRLRSHIDPRLPYRLRGWPQQLAQITDYLVGRAIEVSGEGAVGVSVDAAGGDHRRVRLSLTVRDKGEPIAPPEAASLFDPFATRVGGRAAGDHGAFGLAVVRRLVELMGGEIASGGVPGAGGTITVTVPLEFDEPPVDASLDLERCLVLIATEDSQFASEIAEPLNAWNADPRWIDSFEKTLGFVDRRDARACSVLIVDGRQRKLAALSFAHRAVTSEAPPSFVLFIADRTQIGGLVELADDELDAVLPAPLDNQLFANALHALPLWHGAPARPVIVSIQEALPPEPPPLFDPADVATPVPQVTPIATHPRFAAEAPIVDPRAVAALRGLGGGDEFLGEVIDSFRADAREIMQRLVRSAAAADSAGFARGLHALRSCAANLGGTRLCEVLLSLREVGAQELREQGSGLVQRLGDELARLDAALAEFADKSQALASG